MKTEIFGLAFGLALVMVVAIGATVLPAMAASTDDASSTGSFTLLNTAEPTISEVDLYDAGHSGTVTQMDPPTEYAVKISVGDANTLSDIDTITVVISQHDYSGSDDDVNRQATYTWTPGGTNSGWDLTGPLSTHWACTANSVKPDLAATSGDFYLNFEPSEVAIEDIVNKWDIDVTVSDGDNTPVVGSKTGISMLVYVAISATDASFGFGSIDLGDTDKPITGTDTDVDVKVTANKAYKLASKSVNWFKGTDMATLDWDGTLELGHFSLKNDGADSVAPAGTDEFVRDGYITITDFLSKTAPTAEEGDDEPIYVWASVASTGFVPGIYSGMYTVEISPA